MTPKANESRAIIFLLVFTLTGADQRRYPQNALECYASSSPNKKIICAEDRNSYCVKEVISSPRKSCGKSLEYPSDFWDIKEPGGGLCVYKKCSDSCPNATIEFENDGEIDFRNDVCCTDSLCNSACEMTLTKSIIVILLATIFLQFITS